MMQIDHKTQLGKKEVVQYRLALLVDVLETCLTEIPLIKGATLSTIDEVVVLANKIPLSQTRRNTNDI
jgi:hypothetical protein